MSVTRILDHNDIAHIVAQVGPDDFMRELISELRKAFALWSTDEYDVPARTGFHYATPVPGLIEWMPLHHRQSAVFQKAVGYHPQNPGRNRLPTVVATFVQFDQQTGELITVADGGLLTAMRTGAASAVATEALRDLSGPISLGLIGCGAQAVSQLHAILQVAQISEIRIFDTDQDAHESFAQRVQAFAAAVPVIESSPCEIAANSDVLCTATSVDVGQGPVMEDCVTRTGLHVNAIGSDFPGKIELPLSLLKRSLVIPDFPEQAAVEGECQQLEPSERGPSLMKVMGDPQQLANAKQATTVFDSTGWALEDYISLKVARQYADEMRIGRQIELSVSHGHPRNPYAAVLTPALTGVK